MVRKNVAEILTNHVTFELEAIDRMYLNAYVPSLQTGAGFVYFLKTQLGVRVPSTVMVAPMSERFVETQGIDLVTFAKGQRKDDVAKKYLATLEGDEGVLFVGKAQEKASVFRTEKRRDAHGTYPWIIRATAMPNQYYVYVVDRDFGPLFIKFCSYFPYATTCFRPAAARRPCRRTGSPIRNSARITGRCSSSLRCATATRPGRPQSCFAIYPSRRAASAGGARPRQLEKADILIREQGPVTL